MSSELQTGKVQLPRIENAIFEGMSLNPFNCNDFEAIHQVSLPISAGGTVL